MSTELSLVSYSLLQSISVRIPMKTVSTKLDKKDHERFLEICNKQGQTVAEYLRGIILDYCRAEDEYDAEQEENPKEPPKITVTQID